MRRVAGSSTRSIIRAASPFTSGTDANSRNATRMTPSDEGICAGKGSVGVCADETAAASSTATMVRVRMNRTLYHDDGTRKAHLSALIGIPGDRLTVPDETHAGLGAGNGLAVHDLQRCFEQRVEPVHVLQPVGGWTERQEVRADFRVQVG